WGTPPWSGRRGCGRPPRCTAGNRWFAKRHPPFCPVSSGPQLPQVPPGGNPALAVDVLQVFEQSIAGNAQFFQDLLIVPILKNQAQDLPLPGRLVVGLDQFRRGGPPSVPLLL